MNYQKITKFDTANGPGIRTVLWVSGCDHKCKGCHNPQTWDGTSGKLFTRTVLLEILDSLKSPNIAGLTLSGGDPLYKYNLVNILDVVTNVKKIYPDKTIWIYTGYTWEYLKKIMDIYKDEHIITTIIENTDVLVDGKFELDKKDISLKYRGSSNQRVIDVQASLYSNRLVLYNEGD